VVREYLLGRPAVKKTDAVEHDDVLESKVA
jgi:hypothetical protein